MSSLSKLAATQTGTLLAASGATIAANMPVASGGCVLAIPQRHPCVVGSALASHASPPSGPRPTASTSPSPATSTSDTERPHVRRRLRAGAPGSEGFRTRWARHGHRRPEPIGQRPMAFLQEGSRTMRAQCRPCRANLRLEQNSLGPQRDPAVDRHGRRHDDSWAVHANSPTTDTDSPHSKKGRVGR